MKNFIITEVRTNREGREHCVDSFMQALSLDDILDKIKKRRPDALRDNKILVKEIKPCDMR